MSFYTTFVIEGFSYRMYLDMECPPTGITNFSFPYYVDGEAGSLETKVEKVTCNPLSTHTEFFVLLSVDKMHPDDLKHRIEKLNKEKVLGRKIGTWEET